MALQYPVAYLRDLEPDADYEALAYCLPGDPGAFPVYAEPTEWQRKITLIAGLLTGAGLTAALFLLVDIIAGTAP